MSVNKTNKKIYENFLGQEFYLVENPYNSSGKFSSNTISEAIKTIQEDLGDQIISTKSGSIVVIRYLDRAFGNEVKEYCLTKYKGHILKDVKYCLCIEGSWSSRNYLKKDGGIAIKNIDVGLYDSIVEAKRAKIKLNEKEAFITEWFGDFQT